MLSLELKMLLYFVRGIVDFGLEADVRMLSVVREHLITLTFRIKLRCYLAS